jgi:hypothetical protein
MHPTELLPTRTDAALAPVQQQLRRPVGATVPLP